MLLHSILAALALASGESPVPESPPQVAACVTRADLNHKVPGSDVAILVLAGKVCYVVLPSGKVVIEVKDGKSKVVVTGNGATVNVSGDTNLVTVNGAGNTVNTSGDGNKITGVGDGNEFVTTGAGNTVKLEGNGHTGTSSDDNQHDQLDANNTSLGGNAGSNNLLNEYPWPD